MLTKELHEGYDCYRGEWEDESTRVRLHLHAFPDQTYDVLQLEIAMTGIGPVTLIDEGGELPCCF
jgi:hypothetical protein